MEYRENDRELQASVFLELVNQVWPGCYDKEKTQAALSRTINITAYDGGRLAGCLRILSDGYCCSGNSPGNRRGGLDCRTVFL